MTLPVAALLIGAPLAGCVGGSDERAALRPEDFRQPEVEAVEAAIAQAPEEPSEEVRTSLLNPEVQEVRRIDEVTARAGLDDVEVLTGPPAPRPARPRPALAEQEAGALDEAGEAQIAQILASAGAEPEAPEPQESAGVSVPVDAMVGHINGRPLFASEFFEPMEARLRVEAERMTPEQWLRFAREQVQLALRDRIRDELLLAELESSLSPEERTGLLAFVGRLRENIISENRGSESIANQRLMTEEGLTLDQKVLQERNRMLIREQLRRAVSDRVFVSWREVRQAYEREKDVLDPPPVATLRMVWAANEDAAGAIASRLDAGEPFASIANDSAVTVYQPAAGGVRTVTLLADAPYEANEFFAPPVLNDAARALAIGQTIGPIDYNERKVWLHLDSIQDEGLSLYEAQLQLHDSLVGQRFGEAQTEYFSRLIERGSLSDIEQMERRLFQLAAERYLLSQRQ
ncbi:MAG: peptidyl-prolyl cis-trans isomerase [Phycisphaerales bacterium]